MAFKINISMLASSNIENALEYYNSKSTSSAKNFKIKLKDSFNVLKNNPYFILKYKGIRAFPVKNFPYLLFYLTLMKEIKS